MEGPLLVPVVEAPALVEASRADDAEAAPLEGVVQGPSRQALILEVGLEELLAATALPFGCLHGAASVLPAAPRRGRPTR